MNKAGKKTFLLIALIVVTIALAFLNLWLQKSQQADLRDEGIAAVSDGRDGPEDEVGAAGPLVIASGIGSGDTVSVTGPEGAAATSQLPLAALQTVKGWHWAVCRGEGQLYFYSDPSWSGVTDCIVDAIDPVLSMRAMPGNQVQQLLLHYMRADFLDNRQVSNRIVSGLPVVEVSFSEGVQADSTHLPAGIRRSVYLAQKENKTYEFVHTRYPEGDGNEDTVRDFLASVLD